MLTGIDPLLTPDLLRALAAMGHGDELAIVDANYPAAASGRSVIALPGVPATSVLRAVLSVLPLDDFTDAALAVMRDPGGEPPILAEFRALAARTGYAGGLEQLERFAFYDRVRTAFAVAATGERRLYGNILVRKGVVRLPEEPASTDG